MWVKGDLLYADGRDLRPSLRRSKAEILRKATSASSVRNADAYSSGEIVPASKCDRTHVVAASK
jgi:hypothetical protein